MTPAVDDAVVHVGDAGPQVRGGGEAHVRHPVEGWGGSIRGLRPLLDRRSGRAWSLRGYQGEHSLVE